MTEVDEAIRFGAYRYSTPISTSALIQLGRAVKTELHAGRAASVGVPTTTFVRVWLVVVPPDATRTSLQFPAHLEKHLIAPIGYRSFVHDLTTTQQIDAKMVEHLTDLSPGLSIDIANALMAIAAAPTPMSHPHVLDW